MTRTQATLFWASLILIAAVIMSAMNVSDAANIAIITGLSGGAWAALNLDQGCGKGYPR